MYKVVFSRTAEKEMEKLPGVILRCVALAIDKLEQDPRPPGCKKLKGSDDGIWRI